MPIVITWKMLRIITWIGGLRVASVLGAVGVIAANVLGVHVVVMRVSRVSRVSGVHVWVVETSVLHSLGEGRVVETWRRKSHTSSTLVLDHVLRERHGAPVDRVHDAACVSTGDRLLELGLHLLSRYGGVQVALEE